MLNDNEIQVLRDLSLQIAAPINEYIIADICERIAASGKFTATADYMAYRAETLGLHWKQLRKEIAKRLKIAEGEVDRLYEIAAQRTYADDARRIKSEYLSFADNPTVRQMTRAAAALAEKDLLNITQTLGMVDPTGRELPLRKFYASTMDFVFHNVSYGAMDYNTAVRYASTRLAEKGVTVINYESGVKTSLEAAVRRNVMGGLGLMVEKISQYNHDAMGADGWEISAHAMSAPDHEPIQGLQYTDAEYTTLNDSLKRRIGTLNCGHNAFPIIIGVSEPQYTPERLEEFKVANADGVTIDGKHYSLYEATQRQRGLERRIRYWKRQNDAAQSSGDTERAMQTKGKLNSLNREYKEFSKVAGLRTQEDRLYVSGLKEWKGVRFDDIIKDNDSIKLTLHKIETEKQKLDYEVGTILDRKGNIIHTTEGTAHNVQPPAELLKGNIFTHNHPSGGTFSGGDIKSFVKYGLHELRASTPQGIAYSLRQGAKETFPGFSEAMNSACTIKAANAAIDAAIANGEYTAAYAKNQGAKLQFKALNDITIRWLRENAEKYGYVFEVTNI